MSREVPEGWQATTLSQLASIVLGQSPKSDETNDKGIGLPFFQGNAEFGDLYPEPCRWAEKGPRTAEQGDILISVRAPVGQLNLAPQRCFIGRGLGAIIATAADAQFLLHALRFSVPQLQSVSQGSTFDAVNRGDLSKLEIALPPLPEQIQIAKILSSVDDAIAATRAVIEQTKEVKQRVLEHLLTKGMGHTRFKQTEFGQVPEAWEVKPVEELCILSNGNGFRPPEWSETGLPIIRIQNLNGSKNFNYFNGAPLEKWLIHPGDLLFAWAGVRGVSFGPTIWGGPLSVLNQHIFKVSCRERVDKLWLFHMMRLITSRIEAKAHGFKDSLLHVHKKEITGQLVPVPSFAEQIQISARMADFQSAEDVATSALQRLLSTKSALMFDLLTGRKRVTGALSLAAE